MTRQSIEIKAVAVIPGSRQVARPE